METPRGEAVRLQKYLSRAGIASRREGERLITEGRVSVDGQVVTELGTRVVPGRQVVCVNGIPDDAQGRPRATHGVRAAADRP